MNRTEAKRLKVGDRVMWGGDPTDVGEVIARERFAVEIKWEDTQPGLIHVNDCANVTSIPND